MIYQLLCGKISFVEISKNLATLRKMFWLNKKKSLIGMTFCLSEYNKFYLAS